MNKVKNFEKALEYFASLKNMTKLHPNEFEPEEIQNAYSEGATSVFNDVAEYARNILNRAKENETS